MSKQNAIGAIEYSTKVRKTDYLYRVSIKGLVRNRNGEVLVVKESGRDWWDLPGGGMDHGEDLKMAIAREMYEEVSLSGEFTYQVVAVDEPMYLDVHDFWQVRLIFEIWPEDMNFEPGEDADEVAFMHPNVFKDSAKTGERRVYAYAQNLNRP